MTAPCNQFKIAALLLILLVLGVVQPVLAFIHPGIPLTTNDLDYVKARLAIQPWKSGWDTLQADAHASTNYTMQGPYGLVSRVPFINQNPWKNDMDAVYKLSLRWYYTGNTNYAVKATAIFDAWATTMTNYGGNEAYLDLGDYAVQLFGGPEILRSTYPGWTALNTQHATNYFQKAIRPALYVPYPLRGANQGMSALKSAMGLAIFCDDTNYWNQCLFAWRNDPEGLNDTSPLGMLGDTGRDQGHSRGHFMHYAWGAAVAWAQGVDLFSEQDNRIAKCAEYFSKYNLYNTVPYVTFGSLYGMYPVIGPSSRGFDLPLRNIIHTAYVTRKGMNLPWIARMSAVWGDDVNFEFLREADSSTATAAPLTFPAPAAFTNWTDVDIGGPAFAGSATLSNGVWTIKGGGADVDYSTSDQFHFAYVTRTNDFVMIARVLSETNNGSYAKAGLMVRDSLSSSANFADVYLMPSAVEAMVRGALQLSHGDQVRGFPQTMPYWIKVERRGPWLGRYCSPDGLTWQPMNYAWTTMSNAVFVGLMATANDNTKLMTATMDNVAISDVSGIGVVPFAPTGLTAAAGNAQAMLSWTSGAGANYCNVKRATSSGGPYTTIATNYPATTFTDIDLTNGTTYFYVVSCTNAVGEGSNSIFASVTPSAAAAVPSAPTGLTVFASDSTADVTWNAVVNATSYNVKRATSPGGPFTRLLYGTDRDLTRFTDMDVTNGVTYYYVVNAVNYFGESSNQLSAIAGTPQPALVWTGATNSTWDVSTTKNWSSNNVAVTYQNGGPVQFDDTAFLFTINPATTVTPSSVLFVASVNSYTLSATGIGGTASVMKRGTASLNVNAAQPFSGGMTIAEPCQINFSSSGSIGTGVTTVNADVNLYASSSSGWTGTLPNGFNIADTAALTYSGDYKVAFNGPLSGGGSLNLSLGSHASTLSMSANNSTFNGTINVTSGPVLTLNATSSGSSNAVWNLAASGNRLAANVSGGTFYLGEVTGDLGNIYNAQTSGANTATFFVGNNNADDEPIFSGAFVDNGNGKIAITKSGTNTQTFLGTNNYAGLTTVAAGELIVTRNAVGAGGYTVNNGGTLGVLNLFDGLSLAVSNLTLATGSGLDFQNVSSASVPLISASNIILNGSCTVMLTGTNFVATGVYPLINFAGKFTGNFTNLQLQSPAGSSGILLSNAHQIAVSVFAPTPAAPTPLTATLGYAQVTLNWTASPGATSYNVKRALVSGGPYTLIASVTNATYLDTGLTNTTYFYVVSAVNSSGEGADSNEASAVIYTTRFVWSGASNSSWDLTTTGNWKTNGASAIYQDGYGVIFDDTAAGSTAVSVATNVSPVSMEFSNSTKNYTLTGASINGAASLTKSGSGMLTLGSPNSFSGGTILVNGTLRVTDTNAFGSGLITLAGGTWSFTNSLTIANDIFVATNTTTAISESAFGVNLILSGDISGGGNLTASASANYGGTQLSGDNSSFTGTFTVNNNASQRFRFLTATAGSSNAVWTLNNNTTDGQSLNFGNGTIYFGALSGNGQVRQDVASATSTLEVGALNQDSTFSGVLQNNVGVIALNKVGTGTFTLSGANAYTGVNSVKRGRLLINQNFTGAGGFNISSNATLAITNAIPASRAALGAITLAAGSTLEFQNVSNLANPFASTAGFAVSGASVVLILGTNYLVIGNTYPLLTNSSGTMTGLGNLSLQMPPGYGGTLVSNANQILLSVTLPPVPAMPLNLVALPGDAKVNLSWNSAANATGYNLKRSLTNGGPYAVIATNYAALGFTNTGLLNGTNYFYIVSATNIAGESGSSAQASARPVSTSVPQVNLAWSAGGLFQINWPADHTGWRLQAQTNSNAGLGTNWFDVVGATDTNQLFVPVNLTNGSVFYRLVYP